MSVSRRQLIKSIIATSAAISLPNVSYAYGKFTTPGDRVQQMYDWHCQNFFDFNSHLPTREQEYVRQSYRVMDKWSHGIEQDFSYSVASFSHRINGDSVNSSRLYAGSFEHYQRLEPQIVEILKHRGLDRSKLPIAQQTENYRPLLGLGWNVEEDDFKVYGYVNDLRDTPDSDILDLYRSSADLDSYPFGLVSYTFRGNRIAEKKVYVGARKSKPIAGLDIDASDISHVNYMITSERGRIPQIDLAKQFSHEQLGNEQANEICEAYKGFDRKETLDTLAYHGAGEIDLYFP